MKCPREKMVFICKQDLMAYIHNLLDHRYFVLAVFLALQNNTAVYAFMLSTW